MFNRASILALSLGATAALAACGSAPDYAYTQPATTTVMVPAVVPSTPVIVQPQSAYVPPATTYVFPTAPTYTAPAYVAPRSTYVPSGNSPITENKDIRRNSENGGASSGQ
jgi:hypothetical protein